MIPKIFASVTGHLEELAGWSFWENFTGCKWTLSSDWCFLLFLRPLIYDHYPLDCRGSPTRAGAGQPQQLDSSSQVFTGLSLYLFHMQSLAFVSREFSFPSVQRLRFRDQLKGCPVKTSFCWLPTHLTRPGLQGSLRLPPYPQIPLDSVHA